ncbi:hypothetical protein ACM7TY_06745, partial [Enterobacter hormaechei]|uniref:hypothetical protein n=1 Tax=Enterobacter hormaechei TaxID=158836 RepID=UPI000697CB19|nr:hypothetical protein [Enterobacter hormaechei]
MTVSTVVDHNDYTGNGVTTSFPYTFRIFKKTDLAVSVVDLNENITVLVLDTDYTVTNAGGYNGGSVVLTTPLANGWQISIARELEPTQETDLRNQGKFFAEVHEDAFDKLTMLIQQAYSVFRLALRKPSSIANWYDALNNYIRNLRDPRDPQDAATKNYVDTTSSAGDTALNQKIDANFARTLRVPEASVNQLDTVANRANKILAWDNSGQPISVPAPSGSAADVFIELAKPTGADKIGYQHPYNSDVLVTLKNLLDDRISVTQFGVVPDGTDVTAKLCAALDAANGDYSQLVEYGKNRKTLYIPPGDYVVDMTKLTGIHASAGRFVIRCNIDCVGRIPNGDFLVAHVRSINVSGLSGKSLNIRGFQFCNFINIDMIGETKLMGSTSFTLPGLISWGGGSYWNNFERLRSGTTSGGGKLIIDCSDGSVNQNSLTQVLCSGIKVTGSGSNPAGILYEAHQNSFYGVDCSGTGDYLLDNDTPLNQHNIVRDLYGEVNGNGRIRGNWSVIGYRCQFGNVASTLGHMNTMLFSEPSSNQQGGDFMSGSIANLCPSGDWSVINAEGAPVDYKAINSGAYVGIDPNEPSGCGRWFGYATTTEVSYLQVAMLRSGSGYVRGAFYLRGEPLVISIQSEDSTGSFYQDVTKFTDMGNSWRLYRFAGPVDKTKASRVVISVGAGKSLVLGGFVASPYQTSFLPAFCGWDKCKGKASIMPNSNLPPVGFIFYRSSAVNPPTDPTYAWVHKGSGAYSSINVAS